MQHALHSAPVLEQEHQVFAQMTRISSTAGHACYRCNALIGIHMARNVAQSSSKEGVTRHTASMAAL